MRRATTVAISAAVLPGLLALAACSGSSGSPSAAASTASAGAAASAGASAGVSAGGSASGAPGGALVQGPTSVPSPYGNVGLSSTALNAALVAAAGSATAVHITGTISSGGQPITIDVQLNKDGTSAGTITSGSNAIPFIAAGGTTYIQCTAGMITLLGLPANSPTIPLIKGKWVSSTGPIAAPVASGFTTFMSLSAFIGQTVDSGDTFVADGIGTVNGQPVADYKDSNEDNGALILSVPVSGPVLPVQDSETGTTPGSMTFTWNKPTTVSAPPAAQIYTAS